LCETGYLWFQQESKKRRQNRLIGNNKTYNPMKNKDLSSRSAYFTATSPSIVDAMGIFHALAVSQRAVTTD